MVKTRGQIKAARRKYYLRSKKSKCKGKGPAVCRSLKGCKYASKGKRTFCRKSRNVTKRSSPGSRRRKRSQKK